MDDQKIENLLNLALNSTEEERRKSGTLEVGYEPMEKTWELIVKYHGTASEIVDQLNGQIVFEDLSGGYAVVTIEESLIDQFASLEEIEYIEKPKRLFFSVNRGKTASCIFNNNAADFTLAGEGVLIGIIDSGIDYRSQDFRNPDGTTRILWLWDQSRSEEAYSEAEINAMLGLSADADFAGDLEANSGLGEMFRRIESSDISGHGTAVAGIAAGNGRNSEGRYRGVAYQSRLVVVKLGTAAPDGFPRTTQLMRAVHFCIQKALEAALPIAVNISFGNTYGSHQGDTLLELYLNHIAGVWKNVICVGSGNEGAAGGHAGGKLTNKVKTIELAVGVQERALSLQLWKQYEDTFTIELISPNCTRVMLPQGVSGTWRYTLEQTELLVYFGEPTPYSVLQELFIDMLPAGASGTSSEREAINTGIWRVVLTPVSIINGVYDIYLPSESILSPDTRFLLPTPDVTMTIPSVASSVITVAAYDSLYRSYASFSGRGFSEQIPFAGAYKPTLSAPGVGITSVTTTGGYASFTGTSFATPFVTGAAALLMEWGITRGNDPYLYGEKVKAYLIRGARQLPGLETPNPMTGWGALCVRDSLLEHSERVQE